MTGLIQIVDDEPTVRLAYRATLGHFAPALQSVRSLRASPSTPPRQTNGHSEKGDKP